MLSNSLLALPFDTLHCSSPPSRPHNQTKNTAGGRSVGESVGGRERERERGGNTPLESGFKIMRAPDLY